MTIAELIQHMNANPLTSEQVSELNAEWKKRAEEEIEREFRRDQARIESLNFVYSL